MKRIITLIAYLFILHTASGQGDCSTAIELTSLVNWCSAQGQFNNEETDIHTFPPANCFTEQGYDIWFRFTAIARDINITILGNDPFAHFGTLPYPEAVLYSGDCGGTLYTEFCTTDSGLSNAIELYKGGLVIGREYYIRVQGRNRSRGSFQLCINNYNPQASNSSDCISGAVLCNKETFVVHGVVGPGFDPLEMDDAQCFRLPFSNSNFETNSTWFKWRIKTSGTLVFTLTPLNPTDDLDFVLYRLPNGLNDCSQKQVVRCMAAGEHISNYPSPCHGPTGLNFVETDISEAPGCSGGQNNFLRYVDVTAGEVYVLAVNNFTSQGSSFSVEFGGSAEFDGPRIEIEAEPVSDICPGDEITITGSFDDQVSRIVSTQWFLDSDAEFMSSDTDNPLRVSFKTSGYKYITAVIENELGCVVTHTERIYVQSTPDYTVDITYPECFGADDGQIVIVNPDDDQELFINWNNGMSADTLRNLSPGLYSVTVSNGSICVANEEILLPEIEEAILNITSVNSICLGGANGSINISVDGQAPPYSIDWHDGSGFGAVSGKSNLAGGFYPVSVMDSRGCIIDTVLTISEIDIVLDPDVDKTIHPTCPGSSDGQIELQIIGGESPYTYDWFNTGDFVAESIMNNLPSGVYNIVVRDANGCKGYIVITLTDPSLPVIDVHKIIPACSDSDDGELFVDVAEGNAPFSYVWNNGVRNQRIQGLRGGIYHLTLTDGNGCILEYEIPLEPHPEMILSIEDIGHNLCYGDSTGFIVFSGISSGRSVEFSIDGGRNFVGETRFINLKAGTYDIVMKDSRGCTVTDIVTITERDRINVSLSGRTTIQLGEGVTINSVVNPAGDYSYNWEPAELVDCISCPRVYTEPTSTTVYILTVEDENGCKALDSITVFVEKFRRVYIPNIFSPNGDGVNDIFFPFADVEAERISKMMVFNRWGALMYEEEDLNFDFYSGWDGTFKGEPVSKGVYVYVIEVLFKDGVVITYSGDINVFR